MANPQATQPAPRAVPDEQTALDLADHLRAKGAGRTTMNMVDDWVRADERKDATAGDLLSQRKDATAGDLLSHMMETPAYRRWAREIAFQFINGPASYLPGETTREQLLASLDGAQHNLDDICSNNRVLARKLRLPDTMKPVQFMSKARGAKNLAELALLLSECRKATEAAHEESRRIRIKEGQRGQNLELSAK